MNRLLLWRMLYTLGALPPETARMVIAGLPRALVVALREEWFWQAHGGQHEPAAGADGLPWRVWAMVAGRGFGKTRAGAEWVFQRAREDRDARIALVAASLDEVAKVMIEGESGILGIARQGEAPRWIATRGLLLFPSGARGFAYTAERPGKLRGPQHHFAWCDELAKWPNPDDTWDNLMMGLRLGDTPRTIVTTTPRPIPLLKRVLALPRCTATHGRTDENPHLPADFHAAVREMYGGTRLGRQELEGILFEDVAGALWTRDDLDKWRVPEILPGTGRGTAPRSGVVEGARLSAAPPGREAGPVHQPAPKGAVYPERLPWQAVEGAGPPPRFGEDFLTRIVIGVDPPASLGGDACGILVCGVGRDDIAYVLADHSAAGLSPNGWASRVAEAARLWGACLIVAETNQGGNMVESVLRAADARLPVKPVTATSAKAARATPVALRFETGRARMAGRFPELEDELCALTPAGYQGANRSPDRADAMVWAMTDLIGPIAEPSIRRL